jgi:hypothetical protein
MKLEIGLFAAVALIVIAWITLIGFAIWTTKNPVCLFALLPIAFLRLRDNDCPDNKDKEDK